MTSPRSLRQLPALRLSILLAAACCVSLVTPVHAAPRSAAVDARIRQQLEFQRALHGNPLALHRDIPRARARQARGASPAAGRMHTTSAHGASPYGGGPPVALYFAYDDDRGVTGGALAKYDAGGAPAAGFPGLGLPVILGAQLASEHRAIDDGAGGRIVAWAEFAFGTFRIHAQHIGSTGTRLWGPAGVTVSPDYESGLEWTLIPDGAGGAFFAWESYIGDELYVRVQRINSAGAVATDWPADGVVLGAPFTNGGVPKLAWDDVGGVYVAWTSQSFATTYVQHLDGSGAAQWSPAEGVPLTWVAYDFSISPDAGNGLTLAWSTFLNPGPNGADIYAERLDTAGDPTWGDSGIVVCAASDYQQNPQLASDGGSGVMLGWFDYRAFPAAVYAQRLDLNGASVIDWPVDGARVGELDNGFFDWINDGLGGAFFALTRIGNDALGHHFLQHVLSNGELAANYDPDGQLVSNAATDDPVAMFLDGGGGVLAAWLEPVTQMGDGGQAVFGQHLDIGGATAWGGGNALLLTPSNVGQQGLPALVMGGQGGARVAFQQFNGDVNGVDAGLKRVNQNGVPQGVTTPIAFGPGGIADVTLVADPPTRAIALWSDLSALPPTQYAQRYDNLGGPLWGPGGVPLASSFFFQGLGTPRIPAASDGASGVIAAWNAGEVTVQRIDSTGTPRWGAGGTVPFSGTMGSVMFSNNGVQAAESNGAFVNALVFEGDGSNITISRLCVQKLDGDGNPLWGGHGYDIVNDSLMSFPGEGLIAPDGQGGVFAAYQIGIFPDEPIHSIRIVHVTAAGILAPGWPVEGVPVRNAFESALLTGLTPDSLGNAIVTWMEFRGGRIGSYAQLVTAGGLLQWNGPLNTVQGGPNQGVALALGNGPQVLPLADTDGAGGAVFTWVDGSGSSWDVFAQRITSSGARVWGDAGLVVCDNSAPQGQLALAADGASGALIAWADGRTMPQDQIMIARVLANGTLPWNSNGVVSTLASLHSAAVVDGVARLEWTTSAATFRARLERRAEAEGWSALGDVVSDGTGWIRAEDASVVRGMRYGYRLVAVIDGAEQPLGEVWLDVPSTLAFALKGVRPNPANGPLTVAFTLPKSAPARIDVLDIAGRRVLSRDVGALGAGSHVLNLGEPSGLGSGLYFLRLTQGSDRREVRFTRVR